MTPSYERTASSAKLPRRLLRPILDWALEQVADCPENVQRVYEYGLSRPNGVTTKQIMRGLRLSRPTVERAHRVLRDRSLAKVETTHFRRGSTGTWHYATSRPLREFSTGQNGVQQPISSRSLVPSNSPSPAISDQGSADGLLERDFEAVTSGNVASLTRGGVRPLISKKDGESPSSLSLVQGEKDRVSDHLSTTTAREPSGDRLPWDVAADALVDHYRKLLAERGFTPGWPEQTRALFVELLSVGISGVPYLDVSEAYRIAWALEECVALADRPYLAQTVRSFLVGNGDGNGGSLRGMAVTTGTGMLADLLRRADEVGRRGLLESWLDSVHPTGRRPFDPFPGRALTGAA